MAIQIPPFLQPRTLQQRNLIFMILPTLAVLLVMGAGSLLTVRSALIGQWEQTAIARMQAGAHEIDMRLGRPKRMLMLFQEQAEERRNRQVTQFLLEGLKRLEGVVDVRMTWDESQATAAVESGGGMMRARPDGEMAMHLLSRLEVTPPEYNGELDSQTISLVSQYRDDDDQPIGRIEVVISFFDLVDSMVKADWWQKNRAFLVDQKGNVLMRTTIGGGGVIHASRESFGSNSELERETLKLLQEKPFGTVFGDGMPPDEVSAFYRLEEAPWTVVVVSPGKEALQELLGFRNYYFATLVIGILLALFLIRAASCSTANAIGRISRAAGELARGKFGAPLAEDRRDEVGELTRTFNIMTRQLQERLELQHAMSIAREVQQNLLPQSSFRAEGIDIHGCSLYCEDTGGDYFDLLAGCGDDNAIRVVVGDVVGHGIGAALLMASIRATVRCRTVLPGDSVEVISDVNEILCRDTEQSGNFVSLFYLVINREQQLLGWVRCGHDPAIVYDLDRDQFMELGGKGLVLGFDRDWRFEEQTMHLADRHLVVLIGSDGVWETENEAGETFGKKRVRALMAQYSGQSAEKITAAITEAVGEFRGSRAQSDDITLVVVKIGGPGKP